MQLIIDQAQKELKNHGSYEFPVLISYERLSYFDVSPILHKICNDSFYALEAALLPAKNPVDHAI